VTDNDRHKQPAATARPARTTARAGWRGRLGAGLGILALLGGLAACGGDASEPTAQSSRSAPAASAGPVAPESASPSAEPSELPEPSPSAPPSDLRKVTCEYRKDTTGAPAKFVGYPPKKLPPDVIKAKTMTIKTNHGDIVIDLATGQAPCTVNSFAFLAKKDFFDNTVCHRLATLETNGVGVLQCGDPQAKGDGRNPTDGLGGPGYLFNDENLGPQYLRGVVFMAQGPEEANSNGSQFAISFTDENAQLPQVYTPFGQVRKGMDIIDKIAKGGVILFPDNGDITGDSGGSNAPKIRVVIKDLIIS